MQMEISFFELFVLGDYFNDFNSALFHTLTIYYFWI
ncbi:unnamed protein product [Schistosoma margrebowiei]|uniref:Uncharacterized protein n=1 Tax=Schistosoma margrebowiei TaxID=48269 RepID=A0A183N1X8_9TREM|nr:unnamed protein product [Schistosoma margrebowiei]